MTAIEVLRERGPMRARDIARTTGRPAQDVYGELVSAEARGLAEIRCMDRRNQSAVRLWAARPEVFRVA